jgi:hypothetical protein
MAQSNDIAVDWQRHKTREQERTGGSTIGKRRAPTFGSRTRE